MGPTPASVLLVAVAALAPPPHAGAEPAAVRRPGEHAVARCLDGSAPEAVGLSSARPARLATGFAVGDLRGWMRAEAPKR